jgi:hypothetical protein
LENPTKLTLEPIFYFSAPQPSKAWLLPPVRWNGRGADTKGKWLENINNIPGIYRVNFND